MTSKRPTCKFSVGDTVILTGVNMREPKEVVISRVGRTNVYVKMYGREYSFDIQYGGEKGAYSHNRIRMVQEWQDDQERAAVIKELREDYGMSFDYGKGNSISTYTLKRLIVVLNAGD